MYWTQALTIKFKRIVSRLNNCEYFKTIFQVKVVQIIFKFIETFLTYFLAYSNKSKIFVNTSLI